METVLVLGCSGFTAKHFENYVLEKKLHEKYSFVGVDVRRGSFCNANIQTSDVTNPGELKAVLKKHTPSYIANFVGDFSSTEFDKLLARNAFVFRNICEIYQEGTFPVKKIVTIGSAAEYGIPQSLPVEENAPLSPVKLYGISKALQYYLFAYYTRTNNMPAVLARTFNVAGRGLSKNLSLGSWAQKIKDSKDGDIVEVGNLNGRRDYIAIADAVEAYWMLLMNGTVGSVYNVCMGKSFLMKDILDKMIGYSRKNITYNILDDPKKIDDVSDIVGCNSKITLEMKWLPSEVNLEQSIRDMVIES